MLSLKGCGQGCFVGFSAVGRWGGWILVSPVQTCCSQLQVAVLCAAIQNTAHCRHLELRCWGSHAALRTLFWSTWCQASALRTPEQVKLDWAQRKRKRLDFILLPRFYFYFLGIVNGLCWWPNGFPERLCQFIFLASSPGFFFFPPSLFFNFSHSNRCDLVSHCDFNVHFLNSY